MTSPQQEPQCPQVPEELKMRWRKRARAIGVTSSVCEWMMIKSGAEWGYAQGLAAAQRLAAEERQRGADDELAAVCAWLTGRVNTCVVTALRDARRPPAPTLRRQAIHALRERLHIGGVGSTANRNAMQLALQALEEAGDE